VWHIGIYQTSSVTIVNNSSAMTYTRVPHTHLLIHTYIHTHAHTHTHTQTHNKRGHIIYDITIMCMVICTE
jgi:hypothetical protein